MADFGLFALPAKKTLLFYINQTLREVKINSMKKTIKEATNNTPAINTMPCKLSKVIFLHFLASVFPTLLSTPMEFSEFLIQNSISPASLSCCIFRLNGIFRGLCFCRPKAIGTEWKHSCIM